jgi:hypothetical protein
MRHSQISARTGLPRGAELLRGRWQGLVASMLAIGCLASGEVQAASGDAAAPAASAPPLPSLVVSPDLAQELAKFRRVPMRFDGQALSGRERAMIGKLVEASRYLDQLFWQQSDPQGWQLYRSLAGQPGAEAEQLRRFLLINGSRYDLIRDNAPFVGTTPMPPGHNLYPTDLTREQFEGYVAAHPDQKAALYDPLTVVRRNGTALRAVPYHIAYRQWLEPMARLLRAAAVLSDDPPFAKYLRLRADALLSDDYFQSDLAWLDLDNPKIDLIFAPYETYLDDLLGVKTSYGASVLVRNDAESRKLEAYQQYVPQMQEALPLAAEDRPSKQGLRSPMEVMDAPFRGGDLRHGYQAVADNLPNDPRVHEQRGSKKIFFKNFMDARVNYVILPIAVRLLRADQAAQASAEGYLATTIMHEISHGLGPAFARVGGQKRDIRAEIGAVYSGLEEAKADIVGLYILHWLVEHGAVPADKLGGYYISYVAGILRTVRFGLGEAHGRAEMMEFNYLSGRGVIARDPGTGRYAIEIERMPAAIADLARELLEQEASGDRARAEAWFARYGAMPAELSQALQTVNDVPVDIDPIGELHED